MFSRATSLEEPGSGTEHCRARINMAAADDEGTNVRIMEFLKNGSSPKKAQDVAVHLSITRSEANKHLYALEKKKKVEKRGSNHWRVCCESAGEEDFHETSALKNEKQIWSHLKENGKRRSLEIAKGVGMQTKSDVNKSLYSLMDKGYITNEGANWFIKGTQEATASVPITINNIYIQKNPTNFICQQGPNNTISISESQHTQIGSCNTMNTSTSTVVNERCLPSPFSIHGDTTRSSPEYHSSSVDVGEALPEMMTSPAPSQEVNITQSQLQNSMIGNNNVMAISYQIDGPRREEHNIESAENLTRNNSGFDTDSLSDDTGSSSENGDTTRTITRDQNSGQNINIRDSAVKNTVIGNDTQVTIGDGFNNDMSWLISQTHKFRLVDENDCRMGQTSPSTPSMIHITNSRVQNANFGNDNYLTIEKEEASPENSESEEEKEESVPNECGH
ncbi:Z-DNA-binding protein 1 isoform X2 [Pleurodeles waltl]|uniref:Z-DNA-binding protein 1 isoform X2 n=1 Tax=Pleurodeles waltl TaxID=8319 RepID=UPI0037097D07